MTKAAILVLAGTDSHADLGRVTNALQTAREFVEAGDDVQVVFDGAGTQWVEELAAEDHRLHALYTSVEEATVACEFCADAFGVTGAVEESATGFESDFEGHPSMRDLVTEGYEVITY